MFILKELNKYKANLNFSNLISFISKKENIIKKSSIGIILFLFIWKYFPKNKKNEQKNEENQVFIFY